MATSDEIGARGDTQGEYLSEKCWIADLMRPTERNTPKPPSFGRDRARPGLDPNLKFRSKLPLSLPPPFSVSICPTSAQLRPGIVRIPLLTIAPALLPVELQHPLLGPVQYDTSRSSSARAADSALDTWRHQWDRKAQHDSFGFVLDQGAEI